MNIIKPLSFLVSSLSAGAVVGNAIKHTTPENLKFFGKIGVAIGGFVLSTFVGDKAGEYVEKEIDCISEWMKKHVVVEKFKEEENNADDDME